jgi:hypothetical protein
MSLISWNLNTHMAIDNERNSSSAVEKRGKIIAKMKDRL